MMKTKRFCKSTVSLLLVFMMLVSMLTVGIVSTSAAEADAAETSASITLYFTRPDDWNNESVYFYCWNTTTNVNNGEFPGQPANYSSTNEYSQSVYSANVDTSEYDMIIFATQSKSKQTENISLSGLQNGDQIYYENGSLVVPEHVPTTPYNFTFTSEEDRVVYLVDSAGWGSAYCYAWDASNTSDNNTWNGASMTKVGTHNGHDVYKYTLTKDVYDRVIFNKDDNNKTADLIFQSYSYYDNGASTWNEVGITEEEDPQYYLVGNTITNKDYEATTYPLTEGSYSYTFTLDASTSAEPHKFKIYEATTDTIYGLSSSTSVTDKTTSEAVFSSTGQYTLSLVATGGSYTVTFNPDTLGLSISYTSTGGGDDDDDDVVVIKDKLFFAMVNEIHYFGVTVDCVSSTGAVTTAYPVKDEGDYETYRVAKDVSGKLSEWPDGKDKKWSVYSVDIPADTKYIHFNVSHNSSDDVYWCLPKGDDACDYNNNTGLSDNYHDITNYDYATELYVLYEYDTDGFGADAPTYGYRSIKKTHEDFFEDEEVIPVYTVTAQCAIKDQTDDYDNTITIDPAGSSVTLAGTTADIGWTYDVYVNGALAPNGTGLSSDETFPYEMTEPGKTYEFYIVVTPTSGTTTTAESNHESTSYIEKTDTHTLTATFTGTQTPEKVTIVPNAVYDNQTLPREDYKYNVYLKTEGDTEFIKVNGDTLIDGTTDYELPYNTVVKDGINVVYIEVVYGDLSATTGEAEYEYPYEVETITFNVGLKSSSSYRYIPSVSVNGGEVIKMTIPNGAEPIGYNVNGTQSYWWYWAEVEIEAGTNAVIKFTNIYNNGGSTYTMSAEDIEANGRYQFGYDNLNYSNEVTLYDPTVDTEAVINFFETATHMVATDGEAKDLAQTQVNGVTYYMGDADLDGNLSIMDATTVQLALAKRIELSDVAEQIADYSTDNVLSIYDVTIIQKKLAN